MRRSVAEGGRRRRCTRCSLCTEAMVLPAATARKTPAAASTSGSSGTVLPYRNMGDRHPRSLKYEYEVYVEREIENYKDSLPRPVLLGIGDEAVRSLSRQPQFALTELVLWEEVDRIIMRRLRLPTYQTWRRRRIRILERYRKPEHWGLDPESPLVRAVAPGEANVLVAGARVEGAALYLAANGCDVITVEEAADVVERVLSAAEEVGL